MTQAQVGQLPKHAGRFRNSMEDQHHIGRDINPIAASSNPIILEVNSYHTPALTTEYLPFAVEDRRTTEYIFGRW